MRGVVKYIVVALLVLVCGEVSAQQMKERSLVRKGNREFKREKFEKSVDELELLFPRHLRKTMQRLHELEDLEEIRVRVGQPLFLCTAKKELVV